MALTYLDAKYHLTLTGLTIKPLANRSFQVSWGGETRFRTRLNWLNFELTQENGFPTEDWDAYCDWVEKIENYFYGDDDETEADGL